MALSLHEAIWLVCPHSGSLKLDWPQQATSERYLYGRPALPHYPASLAKLIASQKITTVFGKAVSLVKDYESACKLELQLALIFHM